MSVYSKSYAVGDYKLMSNDGRWKTVTAVDPETGNCAWNHVHIMEVPLPVLFEEWESLVQELSHNEKEFYELKEDIFHREQDIIRETDFKKLYNQNNKDVRKEHLDKVLGKDYAFQKKLEFRIDWIKQYIPLLKEVIRVKQCDEE